MAEELVSGAVNTAMERAREARQGSPDCSSRRHGTA